MTADAADPAGPHDDEARQVRIEADLLIMEAELDARRDALITSHRIMAAHAGVLDADTARATIDTLHVAAHALAAVGDLIAAELVADLVTFVQHVQFFEYGTARMTEIGILHD
jgi:hypothetical protein